MRSLTATLFVALLAAALPAAAASSPHGVNGKFAERQFHFAPPKGRAHANVALPRVHKQNPLQSEMKMAPQGAARAANKRTVRKNANPPISKIGFVSAVQIATGGEDSSQALVGDFNGDGKKDVVTIVQSTSGSGVYSLSVVLGNGDGTSGACPDGHSGQPG